VVSVEDIAGRLAETLAAWVEDADLGERIPQLWLAVYDVHGVRRVSTQLTARQAGDLAALLSGGIRTDEIRMGGAWSMAGQAAGIAGRLGGWRCGGAPAAAVLLVADLGAPGVVATVRLGRAGADELMEVVCLHMQVRRWECEVAAYAPFPAGSRVRIHADARRGAGDTGTVARVRVEPGPRPEGDSVLVIEVHLDHGPDERARPYTRDQLDPLRSRNRIQDVVPGMERPSVSLVAGVRQSRPRVMGVSMNDCTAAWIGILDEASNTAGDDPAFVTVGLHLAWATVGNVETSTELDSEMAWATAAEALADARDLLDQTDTAGAIPDPQPRPGPQGRTGAQLQTGLQQQVPPHPQGALRDGPVLRHSAALVLDAVYDILERRADASGDGRSRLHTARALALLGQAADVLR
jgi:hypothetical protein